MKGAYIVSGFLFAAMVTAAGGSQGETDPLNSKVLEAARAYPDGGGYKWASTGVPERIEHRGERILGRSEEGTYCSGFTFAVVMNAADSAGLLEDKSVEEVRRFQREWYGAVEEEEIRERQCAIAVETLGIGREISPDEARPGDFAQYWRTNGSGHSVIFIEWVHDDDGNRAGLRYRSSQGSTNGIGDHTEYFAGSPAGEGRVDPDRLYFARLGENRE